MMGDRLRNERVGRAWSRLTQRQVVRHGVRVLVFAGALGAAWLIGSSTASAHTSTGSEPARAGSEATADRTVENNTGVRSPHECSDATSDQAPNSGGRTAAEAAAHRKITRLELAPAKLTGICDPADAGAPTPTVAPDPQARPRSSQDRLEGSVGTAHADPRTVSQPHDSLSGVARTVTGPGQDDKAGPAGSLSNAARPVTDGGIATGVPVSHTVDRSTGVLDPILDRTGPVASIADSITSPVTGALANATRPVTDEVTGEVPPWLDEPVDRLVPIPVADLPRDGAPTLSAPPVAPSVDQAAGTTSTVGLVDGLPIRAGETGAPGAAQVPAPPGSAPLPAVPGTGVTNGGATSSYSPIPGGGAIATVPALPAQSAPSEGALLATAYDAALRDLAGEPAVSPD